MTIALSQLLSRIESKNSFPLDDGQREAIGHGDGPLLIAAGPGTGKTEVLVARCLKFICCDGVQPGSIILTTFTDKAAKNLEDRITETFLFLTGQFPGLQSIDISDLRIGTLHSLCNDILQEYRYTAYQNLRLLNEMENALFIHRKVANNIGHLKHDLFNQFPYLFGRNPTPDKLSRWHWAFALVTLFGRLVEDQLDRERLAATSGAWESLSEANEMYEEALSADHVCDFARLLRHFREFLDTGQGKTFLQGNQDAADVKVPLTHVLVDEYQDTNPIQESIYLRLCDSPPHNITVVGDDDQALYRFRGGTVECMVGFHSACQMLWGVAPQVKYLSDNHRSDSDIVNWCNTYVSSFPQMSMANVRIAGKPKLNPKVGRTSTHPAVGFIRNSTIKKCAADMAGLVRDLKKHNVIEDYSQCVLLLRSAQNTPHYAEPYQEALQAQNIRVYNPRSKDYLEQAEVAQCLGAFIRIIDPQLSQITSLTSTSIQKLVQKWASEYDSIAPSTPGLADYVTQGAKSISKLETGKRIVAATPTILYRILSQKPFVDYQQARTPTCALAN